MSTTISTDRWIEVKFATAERSTERDGWRAEWAAGQRR
ncbi:hypothetical protein ABID94_006775 [Streptomyces sp. PvR018]